ncbi:hypothetical protein P9112_004160 [Eukaryota sp. TZLM1-RC]
MIDHESAPLLSLNTDVTSLHTVPLKDRSSVTRVVFNLIKCFLGSGVLTLPLAFKNAGYVGGLVMFPFSLIVCLYSMHILLQCRTRQPEAPTYCDLVGSAYGRTAQALTNVCLVSFQICCCIAYIVLASGNLNLVFPRFSQLEYVYMIFFPVGLLCLLKTPKKLAPFSLLANMALVSVLVLVSFFSSRELINNGPSPDPVPLNTGSFLSSIGIFIYSFEGVTLILPLFNTMKKQKKFEGVLKTTLTILAVVYIAYALGSCFAFGNEIDGIITKLIPHSYAVYSELFVAFSLLLTYPLMMFPVFEIFEKKASTEDLYPRRPSFLGAIGRSTFRLAFVIFAFIISMFMLDHVGEVCSIAGATFGSVLCFILPASIHLKIYGKECSIWRRILHLMIIVFGVTVMILVTYQDIQQLLKTL